MKWYETNVKLDVVATIISIILLIIYIEICDIEYLLTSLLNFFVGFPLTWWYKK